MHYKKISCGHKTNIAGGGLMKKTISNTMFSTGAALVILAVYFLVTGEREMGIQRILEIFGANIVICFGIMFIAKIEIKNIILEYIIHVSYIIAVLLAFGAIFNWYSAVPAWLLVVMAVVIYAFVIVINVLKINKETKEINDLLQKRKAKETGIVS